MKSRKVMLHTLLLIFAISLAGYAQEEALRTQVEDYYKLWMDSVQKKDANAVANLITDDYCSIFMGSNKDQVQKFYQNLFTVENEVRLTIKIEEIKPFQDQIVVQSQNLLEAKGKDQSNWRTVVDQAFLDLLKKDGDSFKIQTNAPLVKDRLGNIKGQSYVNDKIGFSFTVPQGWLMVPTMTGNMSETVVFLAPDTRSAGLFGYLELPYNVGSKQAVEGDDSVAKKMSGSDFEMIKAGDIKVGGLDGYESITRFFIKQGDYQDLDRQRRRVYFSGGGLFYTFNFDAIPPSQWEEYQDDFDSILKSFSLSEEGKKAGAQKLREEQASGEVTGRIYTNIELGCQIAAPEGWTLDPGTLSEQFKIALTIKPPQGNSIVRLMAIDLKNQPISGKDLLEGIVQQQIESFKAIAQDATNEPVQDVQVGDRKGKTFIQQFTLEGLGTMKRKNAFFLINDVLYMILCDAVPAEEYAKLEPDFDKIIQLFTVN